MSVTSRSQKGIGMSEPFPPEEFEDRRNRVRAAMQKQGIDALLISTPENIYYLTGLDHMGYFAYQLLVLPARGEPMLITRAMERAIVSDLAPELRHYGYADGSRPLPPPTGEPDPAAPDVVDLTAELAGKLLVEPAIRTPGAAEQAHRIPVETTCRAVVECGLARGHLALEEGGSFLSYRIADGIKRGLSDARWTDGTGVADRCRLVQSPREQECTRRAGVISDAMLQAGIAAAGRDVNECDVMAAIYDALFRRGGTYPGFVPLVRSSASLVHEHGTWADRLLAAEDLLFLEMSGCVRRYHAPMGRLVFIDRAPASAYRALEVCQEAELAAAAALRPGVLAGDVYEAWQAVLNRHGLESYRRHHCGYSTGIGYPPSWSGGGVPVGLRSGSEMPIAAGMVFHLMSWLLRSDHGDSFLSDTVIVTDEGCEMITQTPRGLLVRT